MHAPLLSIIVGFALVGGSTGLRAQDFDFPPRPAPPASPAPAQPEEPAASKSTGEAPGGSATEVASSPPVVTVSADEPEDVVIIEQPSRVRDFQSGESFERPAFLSQPLHSSGRSVVFGVAETNVADVVVLDDGLDVGFRTGMICQVLRGDLLIAEIILAEVRPDRAAGLILSLSPGQSIRFGDEVRIKTLS